MSLSLNQKTICVAVTKQRCDDPIISLSHSPAHITGLRMVIATPGNRHTTRQVYTSDDRLTEKGQVTQDQIHISLKVDLSFIPQNRKLSEIMV